jgi:hypothetical protein
MAAFAGALYGRRVPCSHARDEDDDADDEDDKGLVVVVGAETAQAPRPA